MFVKPSVLVRAAVVASLAWLLPQVAAAQTQAPWPNPQPSRFYVVLGGTIAFPGSADLTDTGCPNRAQWLSCSGATQQVHGNTGGGGFGGVGYRVLPWLRTELRLGVGGTSANGDVLGNDNLMAHYTADYSTFSALANGYVDIAPFLAPGSLGPFEPYVGAGVGTSVNTIHNIHFSNPSIPNQLVSPQGGSTTQFAWAATIGTGIRLSAIGLPNSILFDIAYRYRDFGHVRTQPGTATIGGGFTFQATSGFETRARSHGIDLAVRVEF
jgi:opacity protein-like surface antigen